MGRTSGLQNVPLFDKRFVAGLLGLGCLVALAFALSGGSEQSRAVEAIQAIGGEVRYDWTRSDRPVVGVSFSAMSIYRRLTDDDLVRLQPHLEALPRLQHLDLLETEISDVGLDCLKGLTHLKTLQLGSMHFPPKVTAKGILALQKALPTVDISFDGPTHTAHEIKALIAKHGEPTADGEANTGSPPSAAHHP